MVHGLTLVTSHYLNIRFRSKDRHQQTVTSHNTRQKARRTVKHSQIKPFTTLAQLATHRYLLLNLTTPTQDLTNTNRSQQQNLPTDNKVQVVELHPNEHLM